MATLRQAIKTYLASDSDWQTLFGASPNTRLFLREDLPLEDLTMENVPPICFVNGLLALTCFLTFSTTQPKEIVRHSQRRFVTLWFYHWNDFALLELADTLAKELLHMKTVDATDYGLNYFFAVDGVEFRAAELNNAAGRSLVFTLDQTRR